MNTSGLGRTLWLVVAVAALGGVLLSLVTLTRPPPAAREPMEVRGAAAAGSSTDRPPFRRVAGFDVRRHGTAVSVDRSSADLRPTRRVSGPPVARSVRVPSLGLDLTVRPSGVTSDGQMALPADPAVLGWYRFGAAPGEPGSTVLAGHVDTRERGIGPLAALAAARPGAAVVLTMPSGRRIDYVVDSIESFDRSALPDEVFSRSGPPRLRLVTCGGEFDPDRGGYQQNVVVTAVPAADRA